MDVVRDPMLRDFYREFQTTKTEVARLRALPPDEADALLADDLAKHENWAQRRYAFLYEEVTRDRRRIPEPIQR